MMHLLEHPTLAALVPALGWALIHSLWQAGLWALLVWAVHPRLPHAHQRHWLAFGAQMGILLSAIITAGGYYEPIRVATEVPTTNAAVGAAIWPAPAIQAPLFALSDYVEQYAYLLVLLWAVGALVGCGRWLGGWWYVQRLRQQCWPIADEWQNVCAAWAQRLRMARPVQWAVSAQIGSPVAVGWWHPLILFPIGLVNQLTPAQVEAILVHELAHLRRADWLAQLLQTFVEALLYYHPAVWWLGRVARTEREYACDDWVLRLTGNPVQYAKTLVQLQAVNQSATPHLALGVRGEQRSPFTQRIHRLLIPTSNTTFFAMERMLGMGLLAVATLFFSFQTLRQTSVGQTVLAAAPWPECIPKWATQPDTVPKPNGVITHDDGKRKVQMWLEEGQVRRLKIDGKNIEPARIAEYKELTDGIIRDLPAPPPPPPAPAAAPSHPSPTWPSVPAHAPIPPAAPPAPLYSEEDLQRYARRMVEHTQGLRQQLDQLKTEQEKLAWFSQAKTQDALEGLMKLAELYQPSVNSRHAGADEQSRIADAQGMIADAQGILADHQVKLVETEAARQRAQVNLAQQQARLQGRQAEMAQTLATVERVPEHMSSWRTSLESDGLLAKDRKTRILLTKEEFLINGEKQSAALHEKYLQRYAPRKDSENGQGWYEKFTIDGTRPPYFR